MKYLCTRLSPCPFLKGQPSPSLVRRISCDPKCEIASDAHTTLCSVPCNGGAVAQWCGEVHETISSSRAERKRFLRSDARFVIDTILAPFSFARAISEWVMDRRKKRSQKKAPRYAEPRPLCWVARLVIRLSRNLHRMGSLYGRGASQPAFSGPDLIVLGGGQVLRVLIFCGARSLRLLSFPVVRRVTSARFCRYLECAGGRGGGFHS